MLLRETVMNIAPETLNKNVSDGCRFFATEKQILLLHMETFSECSLKMQKKYDMLDVLLSIGALL